MSLIIFVVVPVCWMLFGRSLGWAVSAVLFHSDFGKQLGRRVGRWAMLLFPALYLLDVIVGLDGNAGRGVELFGSEELAELAFSIPFYGVIGLTLFAGAVYVVRDLTVGKKVKPEELNA